MTLVSYKGNICIPDMSMIKGSTDHHLQTIQRTVIWPRSVYSGRHVHTHAWHDWSRVRPQSERVGWTPPLSFLVLITRRRNQRRRRLTFTTTAECTNTSCCSHSRTMPLQSKHNIGSSQRAAICQKHVQKQNSMKAMEYKRNKRKDRHVKRKTRKGWISI